MIKRINMMKILNLYNKSLILNLIANKLKNVQLVKIKKN